MFQLYENETFSYKFFFVNFVTFSKDSPLSLSLSLRVIKGVRWCVSRVCHGSMLLFWPYRQASQTAALTRAPATALHHPALSGKMSRPLLKPPALHHSWHLWWALSLQKSQAPQVHLQTAPTQPLMGHKYLLPCLLPFLSCSSHLQLSKSFFKPSIESFEKKGPLFINYEPDCKFSVCSIWPVI